MLKFNAESILSLIDEPLKKENCSLKINKGKENQKMNIVANAQVNNGNEMIIKDWKESTKKKYRRSVLRREAEKSLSKDDDLLWDPSFISISSLSQVQLSNAKVEENQFLPKLKREMDKRNANLSENQSLSNDVELDFIDEIIEICMALNRRPVRVAPIERLARLQSRSDFKFRSLADVNCQTIDCVCLRLTTNLALSAYDIVDTIIATNENQNLRDYNALLLSLQILINASLEVGFKNSGHKEMINRELLSNLAQKCLNNFKNNNKDIKSQSCCEIRQRIQDTAKKLFEMSYISNSI